MKNDAKRGRIGNSSPPSSIEELRAELRRPKRKRRRRISTSSAEAALEQIVRARTAGVRASIKPEFVAEVLKELIDRRREERSLLTEVEQLLGDNITITIDDDEASTKLSVDEVMSLSELGTSSWESGSNLHKIEWRAKDEPAEEPEDLDESDIIYEVPVVPVLRSKRPHAAHYKWRDDGSVRRVIVSALITFIALTFGALLW